MSNKSFFRVFLNTVSVVAVIAALAILAAFAWFPLIRITDAAMSPTLENGDIVLAIKGSRFNKNDILVFNYGSKLMVKRIIAFPGDSVSVREDGSIFVNGEDTLLPPCTPDTSDGLSYPYTLPAGKYFAVGDNTHISLDSRHRALGPVSYEQFVGRVAFRLWPLDSIGPVGALQEVVA